MFMLFQKALLGCLDSTTCKGSLGTDLFRSPQQEPRILCRLRVHLLVQPGEGFQFLELRVFRFWVWAPTLSIPFGKACLKSIGLGVLASSCAGGLDLVFAVGFGVSGCRGLQFPPPSLFQLAEPQPLCPQHDDPCRVASTLKVPGVGVWEFS